jgi:hypothetical protein
VAPLADNVPEPQKAPPFDGVMVTTGAAETVTVTSFEFVVIPEEVQVEAATK